jgi:LPS sulfotransferase NodH
MDSSIRVLFLWRENVLAQEVSRVVARTTGIWQTTQAISSPPRVSVDPEWLVRRFHELNGHRVAIRRAFRRHDMHEITYERLCNRYQDSVRDVAAFLGREFVGEAWTPLRKQGRDLRNMLDNYDEVVVRLEHTEWAWCLEAVDETVEPAS